MKTIRYVFWGLVALVLVLVGLANRDIVTLRAMPQAMADLLHISPDIQLPLFVAIFAGVGIGLLIGFLWEWMREHPVRKQARRQGKEASKLRQELAARSDGTGHSKDDVLALVERS